MVYKALGTTDQFVRQLGALRSIRGYTFSCKVYEDNLASRIKCVYTFATKPGMSSANGKAHTHKKAFGLFRMVEANNATIV